MNTNYAQIARNDDEPTNDREDWIAERAAELAQTEHVRDQADDWNDGMQDGEHYSEVERALADLHEVEPSDLIGSAVLERLYRLAKVHGEARQAKALELATDMAEREWEYRLTGPEDRE